MQELLVAREAAQSEQQRWMIDKLIDEKARQDELAREGEEAKALAEHRAGQRRTAEKRADAYVRSSESAVGKNNLLREGYKLENQKKQLELKSLRRIMAGEGNESDYLVTGIDPGPEAEAEAEEEFRNEITAGQARYTDAKEHAVSLRKAIEDGKFNNGDVKIKRSSAVVEIYNSTAQDASVMYVRDPKTDRYYRMDLGAKNITSNDVRDYARRYFESSSPAAINKALAHISKKLDIQLEPIE